MSTLTDAEWAVLGLLSQGEASGYDLSKNAAHNIALILSPTKSRIYALLPRLRERGYVAERTLEQERLPQKRLYSLTAEGNAAFRTWLNDTRGPIRRELLLLKLFFGFLADPAALLQQVQDFREQTESERELLERYREQNLDRPDGVFRNLTVDCGLELAGASLKWAERTNSILAKSGSHTATASGLARNKRTLAS